MKILVVFTGGTIGSSVAEDGYFSTDAKKAYKLLELFKNRCKKNISFVSVEPYRTLSENLNGSHISGLIKSIKDEINKDYDGIIVTHGTDTIQYTASALSYSFGLHTIPIVMVSSNYVLEDSKANGLDNFCAAVEFIENQAGRGTFITYKNDNSGVLIHRGSRLIPHQPYSDSLYSVKNIYFGIVKDNGIEFNKDYSESEDGMELINWNWDDNNSHVLFIQPYVGMHYPHIGEGVKAVVFGSYHSGTLCTQSEDLKEFALQAKKKNIPVFMAGAEFGTTYESVKELDNLSIHILPQASPIAMYVKASMLASQDKDIVDNMSKSLGGDIMQ